MSEPKSVYRTHQVWIKPGHRLYPYLEKVCQDAKHLYNTTNFYIRQVFTAFGRNQSLQPLQQQVVDTLLKHIDAMNERLSVKNRSHPFQIPSQKSPFINYRFLEALFKVMEQVDYRSLPTQSSQGVMQIVFQNWKSFFISNKDYQNHPEKYSGEPRIPGYTRSKGKEVVFTNQDCVIKERKYLKLPKTRLQLNIGKLGYTDGQLKQVRVIPRYGQYVVEIVFACQIEERETEKEHLLAIDFGIDNLATIVTTTGSKPVLLKGKVIKAINQYYNKMKARYTGILRQGKETHEGVRTSHRLERLHLKRHRRIKDLFHKVSHYIIKLAVDQNIGTLVIGQNDGWKQSSDIGRRNNQSFCHVPHQMLLSMLQYKADEQGIAVILTEEAYTSKASFMDHDPLPRYNEEGTWNFSGKRIHRGLYKSVKGLIHADVNGAANIMRKVFPKASAKEANGIEGLDGTKTINVSTPLVLSILK